MNKTKNKEIKYAIKVSHSVLQGKGNMNKEAVYIEVQQLQLYIEIIFVID